MTDCLDSYVRGTNMDTKALAQKILASAQAVYALGDYTSATILYFKTWFALHDHILLQKIGRSPKDHTERFRLLEKEFPETFHLLDREFSTYRETYSKVIDKDTCDHVKEVVLHELFAYGLGKGK